MDIYVCNTYYHVLITVLKAIDAQRKFDVAITHYIPEGQALVSRLEKSGLFNKVIYIDDLNFNPRNRFEAYFWRAGIFVSRVEKKLEIDFKSYSEIYIFMDHIWVARYLKDKRIYYNVIEDGLDVFKYILNTPYAFMVRKNPSVRFRLMNTLVPFRSHTYKYYTRSKYVKSIEVNDKNGIVLEDDKRITAKPKKELFAKINPGNVDNIIDIFLNERSIIEGGHIALILTYAFWADKMVKNEEEQLDLYRRLSEIYKDKYTVLIKPHPRDMTDYSKLEGIKVLPKNFPSELIKYIDDGKIERYISIHSSSVLSYPLKKVDYYETIEKFKKEYDIKKLNG